MSASTLTEAARVQLRARRATAPAKPPWHPPDWTDFLPGRVIIAFDASLLNTGWAAFRSHGHGFEVLAYGTIRPKTEATGYMATWERARLLEKGLWDAGVVMRFIRPDDVLMAVEAPYSAAGHRTESSLVAGLTVWRQAPAKCARVSATHVSAVLLGEPAIKSDQRKAAIRQAVLRYVPEAEGRTWNEHTRDALSVGLTRLFDLREAA